MERKYPYVGYNPTSGSVVFFGAPNIGLLIFVGPHAAARGAKIGDTSNRWVEHQFEPMNPKEALPYMLKAAPVVVSQMEKEDIAFLEKLFPKGLAFPDCSKGIPIPQRVEPIKEKETVQMAKRPLVKGDFIIGSINKTNQVSIAYEPTPHTNFVSAQIEAERLTAADPAGKSFAVLEIKGICDPPPPVVKVKWR